MTTFSSDDMDSLVGVADRWGLVSYTIGFDPLINDNDLAARRDQALLALTELVAEARIPVDVADAVRPALETWADHRCVVGRATRASLRGAAGTQELKRREESHSHNLRAQWVTPLFAVLDAATPTALS